MSRRCSSQSAGPGLAIPRALRRPAALYRGPHDAEVNRCWTGPYGDRYQLDFRLCTPAKGWAQLDTRQDAPCYGNRLNSLSFELVAYAEGDLTHTRCADAADFVAAVRECVGWHKAAGYFIGIDPASQTRRSPRRSAGSASASFCMEPNKR